MKSAVSSLLIIWALAFSARADLTIVQQVGGGGSAEVTMKIKGDKARIEPTPQMAMIFDGKTGDSLRIMHSQKIAVRTSAAQMKAVAAAIGGGKAAAPEGETAAAGKSKVTPTGKKETIDGYETEEYVTETPDYKASYWIAKNYPHGDQILKELQSMAPQALSTGAMATPDFRDFPGLPIRTNVTMGDTKIVSTIKSVKTDPLPDSDFTVPADYKEIKMSSMGGMLNRKSGKDAEKPTGSPNP